MICGRVATLTAVTTVQAASLFFAYLTVLANLAVLAVLVAALGSRLSSRVATSVRELREDLGPTLLWPAWLVAAVATGGSLWFSEVANFTPCKLCWFQRIGMYPLVVILLVAAVKRDPGAWLYVVPIAAVAMSISAYHYLIEWHPALDSGACDVTTPCTLVWFRRFGWISLPYMAFSAFAFIVTAVLVSRRRDPAMEVV